MYLNQAIEQNISLSLVRFVLKFFYILYTYFKFFDPIEGEGTKLAVNQRNNDEPTFLKPPVAKKRKKTSKKPITIRSSDMATESIKSNQLIFLKYI